MLRYFLTVGSAIGLATGLAIALPCAAAAQLVPDRTLPQRSQVRSGTNGLIIGGGSRAGANLFHSFEEFSVLTGQQVRFNNGPAVDRILTRVTGGSVSTIDGTLAANGAADLFLINPNGILFGPNARLNLGGSFWASTAESVRFTNGAVFSAAQPSTPLLTMTVPVGLQMGQQPGDIRILGRVGSAGPGLSVGPNRTLGLLGGNVSLSGGSITGNSSQISLGSALAREMTLSLTDSQTDSQNLTYDAVTYDAVTYDAVTRRGDISLTQGAQISTTGLGGNSIQLHGRRVRLQNGAQIMVTNGSAIADEPVVIDATDRLIIGGSLADRTNPSQIQTVALGTGAGADITIDVGQLRVGTGGGLFALTVGPGQGGDIQVQAQESVSLRGRGLGNLQQLLGQALSGEAILTSIDSGLLAVTLGPGNAGTLSIKTPQLQVLEGGLITTGSEGIGNAGDLTIQSSDRVVVDDSYLVVAALTFGDQAQAGNAGDLQITTPQFTLRNGSSLIAATLGNGDSGDISIRATTVDMFAVSDQVEDPQINTSSFFGNGAGGNITITAERFRLSRGGVRSQSGGNLAADLFDPSIVSDDFIRVAGGSAGEITFAIGDRLEVIGNGIAFGSSIDASSFTDFPPGVINLSAPTIRLSNDGEVSVDTRGSSSIGGQINVQSDVLLLDQQGRITTASLGQESRRGGQIRIDTEALVAVGNSDISADALVRGPGGEIDITAPVIIGTEFRPVQTEASDITAVSVSGSEGRVTIDTRNSDNVVPVAEFSTRLADQSDRIATTCATAAENRFVVVGRGGLPDSPSRVLEGTAPWQDLRPMALISRSDDLLEAAEAVVPETLNGTSAAPGVVEADGWVMGESGEILLITRSAELPRAALGCE
ncbi:MAG: filamentous hemagglutinin N-terminal domain-containing protein [Elainellaceae cyanobacterium]